MHAAFPESILCFVLMLHGVVHSECILRTFCVHQSIYILGTSLEHCFLDFFQVKLQYSGCVQSVCRKTVSAYPKSNKIVHEFFYDLPTQCQDNIQDVLN